MKMRRSAEQTLADQTLVFAILQKAAEKGEACPTNRELAEQISVMSPSSATNAVAALVRRGLITVARGSSSRVVTIVATGRSTQGRVPKPHWRDVGRDPALAKQRARKARTRSERPHHVSYAARGPAMPTDFTPIDRDPCFSCGARPDACQCKQPAHGAYARQFR